MASGELPMVGLTSLKDILEDPPPFLRLTSNDPLTWEHDPSKVTLCVSSIMQPYFPGSRGRVLKFDTEDEFEIIAQEMEWKPLFLHVTLIYTTEIESFRAGFFVTVNTAHPAMKSQLMNYLNEARTQIQEGRRVALEIDFNPMLDDWFRDRIRRKRLCAVRGKLARNAKVVITNSSEFSQDCRCTEACFQCGFGLLACFFPVWLAPYLAYRLYRKIRISDRVVNIEGEVKDLIWNNGIPQASTMFQLNWKRTTTFQGRPVN